MMNETNLVVLQRAFDIFDARYDDADVTSKRLIINNGEEECRS